ncbi:MULTISPECIES: hypothetical protein [Olivibacter]|uniref:Uncharacterized protein n=1 Tax=Olivibacter jilunii TaxID=985016 RepID=A0ABW6B2F5_9SPHI
MITELETNNHADLGDPMGNYADAENENKVRASLFMTLLILFSPAIVVAIIAVTIMMVVKWMGG